MSNLGIVVYHLGASQIANEAIKLVNRVNDAVIFFEQLLTPCLEVQCATMCVTELGLFSGLLVTTNIENTLLASQVINKNKVKHVFYVWDLEWLRRNKTNYLHNIKAYQVPDVLVVRNKDHIQPLENYCNRQPIFKDFQQVIEC